MSSSTRLRLAALLLGSLVALSTAQTNCGRQRCGLSWNDANRSCKKACPLNTSEECAGLGNCWSDLAPCTTCGVGAPAPKPPPPSANPCAKCNVPVAKGGCKCDSQCNCITSTPPSDPGQFPPGILAKLTALTGFNTLQLNNILGMIQGPEQSRPEWWLDYRGRPIWGYAENIGDGRGVTIGLYGATTGAGYNDADQIWLNYYGNTNAGKQSPAAIISLVGSLANDLRWQTAMFDAYITTYWQWVATRVGQLGYRSALTFGALLDTAMNAGIGDDNAAHWGVDHCVTAALSAGGSSSEAQFLKLFLQYRARYPTQNSGNMNARIAAWSRLVNDNQWSMTASGLLAKYIYIP